MTLTRNVFGDPEKQVPKKALKVNVKPCNVNTSRIDILKYLSFDFVVKNEAKHLGPRSLY